MPTVLDIVTMSLTDAGITGQGQAASAFDSQNALTRLNWMLKQWTQLRWHVYRLQTYSKTSTGAQSYTVGPGGDFDIPVRPDRLSSAFARQLLQSPPSQIDFPLEIIEAREDYNRIALKQLTSFPQFVFYDSAYPLASVFPWPIPEATIYAVHISVKQLLTAEVALTDELELPGEYFMAVYLSLAEILRMAYKLPNDAELTRMAAGARSTIFSSNAQIPRLVMPSSLIRPGIYNPYSDRVN